MAFGTGEYVLSIEVSSFQGSRFHCTYIMHTKTVFDEHIEHLSIHKTTSVVSNATFLYLTTPEI